MDGVYGVEQLLLLLFLVIVAGVVWGALLLGVTILLALGVITFLFLSPWIVKGMIEGYRGDS